MPALSQTLLRAGDTVASTAKHPYLHGAGRFFFYFQAKVMAHTQNKQVNHMASPKAMQIVREYALRSVLFKLEWSEEASCRRR